MRGIQPSLQHWIDSGIFPSIFPSILLESDLKNSFLEKSGRVKGISFYTLGRVWLFGCQICP